MKSRKNDKPQKAKPSITAVSVAMAFARYVANDNALGFAKEEGLLAEHLFKEGRKSLRGFNWGLVQYVSRSSYAKQQSFFNTHVMPGYDTRIALRKFMIKQRVEQAIARGVKQIVIIGGGYDVRGLATAMNHHGVHVYELDRDPVRQSKLNAITNIPGGIGFDNAVFTTVVTGTARIGHKMCFVKCDLDCDNIAEILTIAGFDRNEPSLVIAEGLTVYLDERANRKLLKAIHGLLTDDSELLISYITEVVYPDLVKKVQTKSDELYRFTLSSEKTIKFASKSGFDVASYYDGDEDFARLAPEHAGQFDQSKCIPREVYFSMRKLQHEPRQSLAEVPAINLEVPEMKPVSRMLG